MSFISAAAAKERIGNYLGNDNFNSFDTMSSGMKSDAAKYIAGTENEARRGYYKTMGETNLAGIKKVGGAQTSAANDAFLGNMFGLAGSALMGVSDFGVENDWFKKG